MRPTTNTPLIVVSERLYCALLIFYPAAHRREYGVLMVQVFQDVTRETYHRQGAAGMLLWWCTTLLDLTLTAFEERRKVRFVFSKTQFMHMSGLLLMIGGAFWALAAFSQLQPGDHYTYYGVYQVLLWLLAPGFLLVGLGCIGLALRYKTAHGTAGQWTLVLTGLGALVMAVGVVGTQIQDSLWNIWMAGGLLHALALTAFGLLQLRRPTLPVFRALPLQIAAGWLVLMTDFVNSFPRSTANLLTFFLFFGMGLAWLAIGQAVHRQGTVTAAAAA